MKKALQIYGSLRNFYFCLPATLNYIGYSPETFDVFLLIDDDDKLTPSESEFPDPWPRRNHENIIIRSKAEEYKYIDRKYYNLIFKYQLELLKDIFSHNITKLFFISEFGEFEKQEEIYLQKKYLQTHSEIEHKYGQKINYTPHVSRLMFRKNWINEKRKEYESTHSITYDWVIQTRFDVLPNLEQIRENKLSNRFEYVNNQQVSIVGDVFYSSSSKNIDLISSIYADFPFLGNLFLKKINNTITAKEDSILTSFSNSSYYNFSRWLMMPEANLEYYILFHDRSIKRGCSMVHNRYYK